MAIFLYLLREVYSSFKIGQTDCLSMYPQQMHLDNFIRPQDVTMFEPPSGVKGRGQAQSDEDMGKQ